MAIKITDRFAEQCSVVFSNNFDTCGTITRSSIEYLTPAQLESLFAPDGLFADLDAWFKTSLEMKACGTRTYGLYDWIMSSSDRERGRASIQIQKVMKNPSIMFPFILGKQDSVINTDFWAISAGYANSAYTAEETGPLDAADKALGVDGDRIIRVVSRYGIDLDAAWFRDRDRVNIFTRGDNGVQQTGQWKVMASAHAVDRSYVDVLLKSENAGSSMPYASAPTSGVLLPGVNNVNDFERWCNNLPNYDGRKEVPFWWQTMRRTRCVDQLYREYYARLMEGGVNEAFKRFGDLSIAERNRQDEIEWQKRWVTSFFFNKPISANQTVALWKSLEDISTPTGYAIDYGQGGKVVAKRANFIGVLEQLYRCDRVRDLQNQPLNFYEFLDENYRIMRSRKSQGKKVTDIDWFTDSVMSANIESAYVAYLKAEYGSDNVQFPIQIGENLNLGFSWRSFRVKHPAGVRINIITHEFFDDWRDAHKTENQESSGIMLIALELGKGGSIYWAQLGSNRKTHGLGDLSKMAAIDRDWACVMETLTQEITLTSEQGTVVVDCPQSQLWIHNIADAIPITTGKSSNPSYTNLY